MAVKGLTASAEAFEALKPRSETGARALTLYSCLCTGTLRGLSSRLCAASLVWPVGRRLAETEGEGGGAPLKRTWQSEVTGLGGGRGGGGWSCRKRLLTSD